MNQVLNLVCYVSGTPGGLRKGTNSGTTTNDSQKEYLAPEREAVSLRRTLGILCRARTCASVPSLPQKTCPAPRPTSEQLHLKSEGHEFAKKRGGSRHLADDYQSNHGR